MKEICGLTTASGPLSLDSPQMVQGFVLPAPYSVWSTNSAASPFGPTAQPFPLMKVTAFKPGESMGDQ